MLRIDKKGPLVQIGARVPKDTREKLTALADSLSTPDAKVTESEVVRQIITDFFSLYSTQNVNGHERNMAAHG